MEGKREGTREGNRNKKTKIRATGNTRKDKKEGRGCVPSHTLTAISIGRLLLNIVKHLKHGNHWCTGMHQRKETHDRA